MARRPIRRGMTLIELLVVLTVLGILAGIAIPRYHAVVDRAEAASMAENVHAAEMGVIVLEDLPLDSLPSPGRFDAAAVLAEPVLSRNIPATAMRGPRGIRVTLTLAADPDLPEIMRFAMEYAGSPDDSRQMTILRTLSQFTGDRYSVDAAAGTARFDFVRISRPDPTATPPGP